MKYVPCFVLLNRKGFARAKTGIPYSREHTVTGLMYLIQSMKPYQPSREKRKTD